MHFQGVARLVPDHLTSQLTRQFSVPAFFILTLLLSSNPAAAQSLANLTINTSPSPTATVPDFQAMIMAADEAQDEAADESPFNPYESAQMDVLIGRAMTLQEQNKHEPAIALFEQAWQISRISHGLYHEQQIFLIDQIVHSAMEAGQWELVDNQYDYLEHLYRRLYELDDPRLETGLQKISSFHVNAYNFNIDGRREHHLRRAAQIFDTRLEVANLTLAEGHPKFQFLQESLAISRHQLYLMSAQYKENLARRERSRRDQILAGID